jgi:hypothetical protein
MNKDSTIPTLLIVLWFWFLGFSVGVAATMAFHEAF